MATSGAPAESRSITGLVPEGTSVATIIRHRGVRIVTLEPGEAIASAVNPGDIVLQEDAEGWWTRFVSETGEIDSYDAAFPSYNKALWTAKAAAEFQAE
jgi:hypothetical protein